jgi:hypothetical protein
MFGEGAKKGLNGRNNDTVLLAIRDVSVGVTRQRLLRL